MCVSQVNSLANRSPNEHELLRRKVFSLYGPYKVSHILIKSIKSLPDFNVNH